MFCDDQRVLTLKGELLVNVICSLGYHAKLKGLLDQADAHASHELKAV